VFAGLTGAGATHTNYFSDIAWAAGAYQKFSGNVGVETFFDQAAAGTLPNFALIDPGFFGAGANDDHPDRDVRLGQALIATVYEALRQSPQWHRCLFVLTYDEHGGFFDHVPPPEVADDHDDFRRLGFRVPTLVAGGPVRRGQVVSTTLEHSSVVATLTRRFGLQPRNQRAEAAADLSDCIDPDLAADPQPGPVLPMPPTVDLRRLREIDAELRATGRPDAHAELWDLAESGAIPRSLDRRDRSLQVAETWLAAGERLGAIELRR
jgi:phospholipase C